MRNDRPLLVHSQTEREPTVRREVVGDVSVKYDDRKEYTVTITRITTSTTPR